jgi:hypothetical protein
VVNQTDLFHPNFDSAVQPFCRNSDPRTSEDAAKQRKRDPGPEHLFVLRWHLEHRDSDANAGHAAMRAGLVNTQEAGRRASRTIREDLGWTQVETDPETLHPLTVRNRMSNRSGNRNRITEKGSAALMEAA